MNDECPQDAYPKPFKDPILGGYQVSTCLWYPTYPDTLEVSPTSVNSVVVSLIAVRAAADIRITYDYDRDGYVISKKLVSEDENQEVDEPEWKEVAFVDSHWED